VAGRAGEGARTDFLTRSGKRLKRTQAFVVLKRIARQANAHLPPEQHIAISPHVLRHTLLRKVANEKWVHYATEADLPNPPTVL
jgi:site-specific recombinase XerD